MKKTTVLAYAALIGKILIYGSSSLFTRELLATTDVLDIIALRFLLTAAVFLLLNLFGMVKLSFKGKSFRNMLLCAVFEPILYFIFETMGISMTSTIIVGVITALSPISSVLFSRIFLKERINKIQALGLFLGIFGVLFIVIFTNKGKESSDSSVIGILFMILAVVSGSMFSVFSRKSSEQFKPMEISCFSSFVGCIGFNSVNIVRHTFSGTVLSYFKPLLSVENLMGFAFLSVLSSIVAVSLGNYALSRIQIFKTAAFSGLSTVYTIILGIIIYNEALHIYHIVGTALILLGIYGVNRFADA